MKHVHLKLKAWSIAHYQARGERSTVKSTEATCKYATSASPIQSERVPSCPLHNGLSWTGEVKMIAHGSAAQPLRPVGPTPASPRPPGSGRRPLLPPHSRRVRSRELAVPAHVHMSCHVPARPGRHMRGCRLCPASRRPRQRSLGEGSSKARRLACRARRGPFGKAKATGRRT